jgi:RNA polymerase sigma factor (sigma-70 family)
MAKNSRQFSEEEFAHLKKSQAGFKEIYLAFVESIYAYAWNLSQDSHLADDITAETFSRGLGVIKQFRGGPGAFKLWLYRTARNCYLEEIRKNSKTTSNEEFLDLVGDDSSGAEIEHELNLEVVELAVSKLPVGDRELIFLRYKRDLSHKQIADVTNISSDNVRKRISRALQTLKRIINK